MVNDKVIVALPAYNEEKYIAGIVGKATGYADIVVVLDDGSTDGTAWKAVDAGAKLIQHKTNKGYGAAIQSILSSVRSSDFDVLVIIDSDLQHDPNDIPKLVRAIDDGYDLAIGCRASRDVPFYRRIGGTILSVATWALSGVWVQDSQCGFRAYSRKAVELIRPKENGMAVSSEIVALATWARLKIKEVPISVRYTDDSSTHNPWRQGFSTLWRVVLMMLRRNLINRPSNTVYTIMKKTITFSLEMIGLTTGIAILFVLIHLSTQSIISDIGLQRSRDGFLSFATGLLAGTVIILFQELLKIYKQLTTRSWDNLSLKERLYYTYCNPILFIMAALVVAFLLLSY